MATQRPKPPPRAAPAPARSSHLDWGHLRFFLELVRTGSHALAAGRLGVDRNTVSRHVAALEAELGLLLFERGPQGWCQTPAGQDLAELARRVEEDVLALARHVDARDPGLRGTVRLTSVPHVAIGLLPPHLPALHRRHPDLILEISADARAYDLSRREADLALRMGRPRAAGLVTRRLAVLAHGFYAAADGEPGRRGAVDLGADPFVGEESEDRRERWLDGLAPGRRVVHRSNSTAAQLEAARHGLGVAVLPCYLGDACATLRRLAGPELEPSEIWLLVHGDLRRTPRVKAVIDWLDEVMEQARPAFLGRR